MGKIRGTHSSPGIYTQITDLSYAAKNLGITSLGLVGETLQGPAFEPIEIKKWDEFVSYFGGTSAEKFKDSQYPKYELPYIAQSYLKASDRLHVCRVLGLSGYNAGPAFVVAATGSESEYVVAVLRSRGKYEKYGVVGEDPSGCPINAFDQLIFDCDKVEVAPYEGTMFNYDCRGVTATTEEGSYNVSLSNKGRFSLKCYKDGTLVGTYSVSLNPGAKDYIYNVLGSDPNEGNAAVFVEELYDVMLDRLISEAKVTAIKSGETKKYDYTIKNAVADPVLDFVTIPATELTKKNLGQRFIYAQKYDEGIGAQPYAVTGSTNATMAEGDVVYVNSYFENNVKKYGYFFECELDKHVAQSGETGNIIDVVKVLTYDSFVTKVDSREGGYIDFSSDFCDYKEQFRYASTPWVVSELKGNKTKAEVKKLFRFHTITDGNFANRQVKISIANIRPDEGTFDVLVRDFNDVDANPVILESYKGVNMVPGTSKYIGLKIGTLNGDYALRSKYVMVEVIENDITENCVPAGFLGYPVRNYGDSPKAPEFTYNIYYDNDVKEKRQYFGLSDITGVDSDMFTYKGKNAYTEDYSVGYTNAFHLDSNASYLGSALTVDGDARTSAITWTSVAATNVTMENKAPVIGTEFEMEGTIYEDVRLRKFTVYPYGGFDGWDIYRRSRTNTNDFKANKYKGTIKNGEGSAFAKISDGVGLALTGNCITSDYYAYLAGINQFENPERYEINLFATPGIDYVNNEYLVNDAIDMVENRLDTFYVPTTPDKPFGASDAIDEMYSSSDAAENLADTNIDTYYAGTYYPWVKYFDKANNIYINLPATKDAVRVMANTDNKRYPWIAPAGVERGTVECEKMHFYAKLEDRDNVYDNRINSLISFSQDGVKLWGNKTMYICEETNPMNRINSVRLMLYLRKLLIEATRTLIFEPNDTTLKDEFEGIVKPILSQVKADRGITEFQLETSQTKEQMDMHEMSGKIWVKPTPTLEYIELEFVVTPQGIEFV